VDSIRNSKRLIELLDKWEIFNSSKRLTRMIEDWKNGTAVPDNALVKSSLSYHP
jgi:hypothetical protein